MHGDNNLSMDLMFRVLDDKGDFGTTARIPYAAEKVIEGLEGLGFSRFSDLTGKQKLPNFVAELICPDHSHHAQVSYHGINIVIKMDYDSEEMTDELRCYMRKMEMLGKELELEPHNS